MKAPLKSALFILLAASMGPAPAADEEPAAASTRYTYRVIASHPHDPEAFTQGLLFADGKLYESTGGYGTSSLRILDLASGRVLRERRLPDDRFGEGLALSAGRLHQLTWKAGIGFIHEVSTLTPIGEFRYRGEGWGLAASADSLVMSDGSAELRFLDPATLTEVRRLPVRDGTEPVTGLNELEFVEGALYANVWPSDRIAIINPANGQVRGWLDLTGLLPLVFRTPRTDVLNGIAYDAAGKRLFVTGKHWPRLFQIEVTTH
ncbi:MAG: glutaminyl-peptide cyclotransferase [Gammaproteobacteria bacterium]|nr:glutaminyl-peptide cyclotransferase [Gammaproteobacteria bacterium]MDE0273976.1 glutaminyl-peptide cyclotransferase [Gammaproteobacteria bacterium]